MAKISRIMFGIAAVLLVFTFIFPIWQIGLDAPQYPEGIGLHIWANKITGESQHDLENINRLNHYIGMQEINPESIPELKIMPFILIFLMLLGFLGTVLNKRKILVLWIIIFMLVSVVGLVDFYKWEFDYGHNLDPTAPIKVPGMSYQPPLIGTKQLLNISASSYPHLGGVAAFLSMGLGILALIFDRRTVKIEEMVAV